MSNAPEIPVLPSEEASSGRHRDGRKLHRGATALTAVIAAGAMAAAAYAAVPSATPTIDGTGLVNSIADAGPFAGDAALRSVTDGTSKPLAESLAKLQAHRDDVAASSMNFGGWSARKSGNAGAERSSELQAERAEAARIEAERVAAEQAAAEQAAAEQAAAEQAAAEQAAAERAAEEEAASRSEERAEAPVEEAAPAPEPAPAPPTSGDPRSIARNMLGSYGWGQDQFGCLDSLWMRESGWNTYAQNPSSGAYGIPQSLPGSKMATAGSDWRTNPATQIRWGLGYIAGRYGSPCGAWAHSQSVGWY